MKTDFIFKGEVLVKIQGAEALRFLSRNEKHVVYEVIGFTKSIVQIYDYRNNGAKAIDQVLLYNDTSKFPTLFNSPAFIRISDISIERTLIEIYDSTNDDPQLTLWLVVGIDNPIPYCDYIFSKIERLDENTYSFVALYDHRRYPTENQEGT